mmetsp:Transcript_3911/g.7104  ORF Transcript_3911/g.7104 Transcript_3911/m.7104 type:complete len:239 (-) Transcript_3911:115-831(-)
MNRSRLRVGARASRLPRPARIKLLMFGHIPAVQQLTKGRCRTCNRCGCRVYVAIRQDMLCSILELVHSDIEASNFGHIRQGEIIVWQIPSIRTSNHCRVDILQMLLEPLALIVWHISITSDRQVPQCVGHHARIIIVGLRFRVVRVIIGAKLFGPTYDLDIIFHFQRGSLARILGIEIVVSFADRTNNTHMILSVHQRVVSNFATLAVGNGTSARKSCGAKQRMDQILLVIGCRRACW